ncbi:hypothetical protein MF271_09545 [Deinococcus sp. KNUC1210]|uniref:hypothetical protein n=1 Tax=Deinococcus sp. KNUC1210 TaxID=2917691 RepID=UPI001EF030E2|nr:hypothetical protein [Deinococcus sp. KNUC1210]ULH16785.1 hypothetical protein MF271_09545 [Deinococcus sp. KNUC1210]
MPEGRKGTAHRRVRWVATCVLVLGAGVLLGLNAADQPTSSAALRWLVRGLLLLTLGCTGSLLWLMRGAMNEQQERLAALPRDRRVASSVAGLATAAVTVVLVGLGVGLWYSLQPSDFLRGMLAGIFGVLPLGIGWLAFRAYRQMDEYAQRVQERAAAFAFLLSMAAALVGFVAAQVSGMVFPLWTLCVFGLLIYAAGVLVQQRGTQSRGSA